MKKNKALIAILLLGVGIRLYMCLTRNVFTDEVFYYTVTKEGSLWDFIFINHWIKDHAILHFVWLKGGLLFTSRISYLRLMNIFLYVGSALTLFKFFKLLKFGRWALFPVFFFSIYGYFINISSMILPYNLVIFFSLLSLFFCTKVFFIKSNHKIIDCIGFVVFTTLASYSDYSFLSMFLFYLLTFIFVAKDKTTKLAPLLLTYGITLILILPGVFQLFSNLEVIRGLNVHLVGDLSLFQSFLKFCEMTILHLNSPTTLLLLFAFYLTLFVIEIFFIANKKSGLDSDNITTFLLIGISYYFSALCFLLINQYVFKVFVERAVWFFPLFSLIMISILIHSFYVRKKYIYVLIIIIFALTRMSNIFIVEGDVAYEMSYKSFLDAYALDKEASDDEYLLIIDNGYVLYPLRYYFLSEPGAIRNSRADAMTKQLLSQRKFRSLYTDKIKSFSNLHSLPTKIKYSIVLPACSDIDLKNAFFKGAQSIYCIQSKSKNDYVFVKNK